MKQFFNSQIVGDKGIIEGRGVTILTIPLYSSYLNPAEHIIGSIKSKMKQQLKLREVRTTMHSNKNRPLCIRMLEKVFDEIAETRFEDYIYASIKEAIQRI